MPNVFSPRDLVSRPDNMDETVPHIHSKISFPEAVYRFPENFVCSIGDSSPSLFVQMMTLD